ncbi:hypothetical protein ABPG75_010633 [Micractinium tetrahymenae]
MTPPGAGGEPMSARDQRPQPAQHLDRLDSLEEELLPDLEAAPLLAAGAAGAPSSQGSAAAPAAARAAAAAGQVPGSAHLQRAESSGDHWSSIAALAALKKSSSELNGLLACRRTSRQTKAVVHDYYLRQNELIDSLLDTEDIHRGVYTNDAAAEAAQVRRALNVSFAANSLLLVMRTAIALLAGSLALAVATLDSVLDVISSAIMFYTTWQPSRRDKYAYPAGKERMEPLGVIFFSSIMATAAFSVIVESVRALVTGAASDIPMMGWVVGGTIGVVAVKLALFLYCRGSRSPAAFALDHLNDVLVNGIGLAGALLGAHVAPAWDPAIAIALSVWVVWAWGGQAREHILSLVGQAAPPSLLQKLTFLAYYHSPALLYIDTVRAFSFGSTYIAEVDIVLPPDMPLRQAHDIGEALQSRLEQLPEVARAYVHLDWETTHRPEHG